MDRKKRMADLLESLTALLSESQIEFLSRMLDMGLSARQVDYLAVIARMGNPRMSDLSKRLRLSNPSITAIIRKFTELGFVEKTRSKADGRTYHVCLTEKGKELDRMHQKAHMAMAKVMMKNLDEAETDQLFRLFEKIVAD